MNISVLRRKVISKAISGFNEYHKEKLMHKSRKASNPFFRQDWPLGFLDEALQRNGELCRD